MEIKISRYGMEFQKKLNELDKFVMDFVKILDAVKAEYAIVSGYVSILFGRSRSSEDIDIIIRDSGFGAFDIVWNEITEKFECMNTDNAKEAYMEYLSKKIAVRFSKKGTVVPNMEVKLASNELEKWVVENKKKVIINGKNIFISPIELQIPFKLFLGSEKDIEDARFLYGIFKNNVDEKTLNYFTKKLKVEKEFNNYLMIS